MGQFIRDIKYLKSIAKKIFWCLLLIIIILSCRQTKKEEGNTPIEEIIYMFKNDWDTITVKVIKIDSLKKAYIFGNIFVLEDVKDTVLNNPEPFDYYKDIKGNTLFIKSYKADSLLTDFFNDMNLRYPLQINSEIIDSIEKYNNKPLPKKFIPALFNPNNEDCNLFSFQTVNIDDENENERIFQFGYTDCFIVAILDNINGKWFYKSRIEFGIHNTYPKMSILNTKSKIINFDYEAGWGSAYYSQNNIFYRYISGKTYKCIDFQNEEASFYKAFTIWEKLNSKFNFISSDKLKIDFIYNLYSFKSDNITPDVFILKGKKESIFYKWNRQRKLYEIYDATNKTLMNPKGFWISTFGEIYKSEIDSIEKFGTKKQKQVFLKDNS